VLWAGRFCCDFRGYSGGAKNLEGGPGIDDIHGGRGLDNIVGGRGNDFLFSGPEDRVKPDKISAGAGNDAVVVLDDTPAGKDFLSCGSGFDWVLADRLDVIATDCERVFFGERNSEAFYASPPASFWDAQPVTECVTCRR